MEKPPPPTVSGEEQLNVQIDLNWCSVFIREDDLCGKFPRTLHDKCPSTTCWKMTDDWSKCQERRHGSVPTWSRRDTEPSVRPEHAAVRAPRGFSPRSPCPKAHPLTTTDTLPQSLQLKNLRPATVTESVGAKTPQCHTNMQRQAGKQRFRPLRREAVCRSGQRGDTR